MMTLLRKDLRLSRLPLIVAITLAIAPYFTAAAMLSRPAISTKASFEMDR